MAHEINGLTLPFLAASAITAGQPVVLVGALTPGSAINGVVVPAPSLNADALGVSRAGQPTPGFGVEVVVEGVVKCVAAASIGQGARVAVGSTNGKLIPIAASGLIASVGPSAGAFSSRYQVGRALESAVVNDVFSVLLDPDQVI